MMISHFDQILQINIIRLSAFLKNLQKCHKSSIWPEQYGPCCERQQKPDPNINFAAGRRRPPTLCKGVTWVSDRRYRDNAALTFPPRKGLMGEGANSYGILLSDQRHLMWSKLYALLLSLSSVPSAMSTKCAPPYKNTLAVASRQRTISQIWPRFGARSTSGDPRQLSVESSSQSGTILPPQNPSPLQKGYTMINYTSESLIKFYLKSIKRQEASAVLLVQQYSKGGWRKKFFLIRLTSTIPTK